MWVNEKFCFFAGGVGKTWLKDKDEKSLIPVGLRERDFKMFPAKEAKKAGPKFGCNAGVLYTKANTFICLKHFFKTSVRVGESWQARVYMTVSSTLMMTVISSLKILTHEHSNHHKVHEG